MEGRKEGKTEGGRERRRRRGGEKRIPRTTAFFFPLLLGEVGIGMCIFSSICFPLSFIPVYFLVESMLVYPL